MLHVSLNEQDGMCDSCGLADLKTLKVTIPPAGLMNVCAVCARSLQWDIQDALYKYYKPANNG